MCNIVHKREMAMQEKIYTLRRPFPSARPILPTTKGMSTLPWPK